MLVEKLPNDATIDQVAEAFGVTDRLNELTPAARRLTKGQMVSILGADNARSAAQLVSANNVPAVDAIVTLASNVLGGLLGNSLTVSDIQSIEQVFGGDAFPAEDKAAILRAAGSTREATAAAAADWEVYACCCPCCCATAVLEPASRGVA